ANVDGRHGALRVRVHRRQLRHGQHSFRRACERAEAVERRKPVVVTHPAGAPGRPVVSTRTLSSRGAFALNACFVAGMLVLSQLPLVADRPVVRSATVAAALVLLAWSALLFFVLRRGQTVTLEIAPRRQHYLQACQQGVVLVVWG